jgi:hypothetical protein
MKQKESKTNALRITDQYRRRYGMVCELQCGAARLSLHLWEQTTASDSQWRVEAHNGSGSDAVVVGRSARTRAEALREVGVAWATESELPAFDWDAVATLLSDVRAI